MPNLAGEMDLRAAGAHRDAESFFERPLYRSRRFLVATALGLAALILDVRLDIVTYSNNKLGVEGLLWWAGGLLVVAWFGASKGVEDIRAHYLNESVSDRVDASALAVASLSAAQALLGGLIFLYVVALILLGAVWRLVFPSVHLPH